MDRHTKTFLAISWLLRLIAAAILLQTLFFKFTGARESVYIFSKLGLEPWGRLGTGLAELAAGILLLVPRTAPYGALLSLGIISGAIASHLAVLGIALPEAGDRGELFGLAVVVFLCSVGILLMHRQDLAVPRLSR